MEGVITFTAAGHYTQFAMKLFGLEVVRETLGSYGYFYVDIFGKPFIRIDWSNLRSPEFN